MKKLKLKIDGLAEHLTNDQMKKINGGYDYPGCYYWVNSNCLYDHYGPPGKNVVLCSSGQSMEDCEDYYVGECEEDECCDEVTC